MKIYLSDIAKEKYDSLSDKDKELVKKFINNIDENNKNNYVYNNVNEIYSSKINDETSIFYSKTKVDNNEYTIILDLFNLARKNKTSNISIIQSLNPNRNPTINPNRNPTINPNRNPTINPNRNPTINPNRNPTTNPNRNPSINPNRNPSININRNPSINPNRNPSINPNRNPTINYKRNRSYMGPYRYDTNLNIEGVIVRVNDKIMLHFNMELELEYYSIFVNDKIQVLFTTENLWIGFLVHQSNVFLVYNENNEWIGTII